jgi:lon-related putative ATP-dependent protease
MKTDQLKGDQLRRSCDGAIFNDVRSEENGGFNEIIGQQRAVEAIEFGMDINRDGYNIFALGPSGSGKTSIIRRFVEEKASAKPVPDDWCYVNNFQDQRKPRWIRLPAGKGKAFRTDMENMVSDVQRDIARALEEESYDKEKQSIAEQFQQEQNKRLMDFKKRAGEKGYTIQRAPTGIIVIPLKDDGEPMSVEEFSTLPDKEQQAMREKGKALQQELNKVLQEIRTREKDTQNRLRELEREAVLGAVDHHLKEMREKYEKHEGVMDYLDQVKEDLVENAGSIVSAQERGDEQEQNPLVAMMAQHQEKVIERYKVNLIVDNSHTEGAPVIFEGDPSLQNLIGKVERQAQFGTLVTNYQMIKPGALHRANGGYLIIEALHLLRQPFAYQPLKQALKEKQIRIKEASELFTPITSAGLEPEPIPLDIKVIIIGNPMYYYLLFDLDEEFRELFNVKADFNTFMERNEENMKLYARFLRAHCQDEKWLPFENSGICRMVEYGSELVGDQTRLSTRFADICNLAREADFWARRDKKESIQHTHVQQAIDAREHRNNRLKDVIQEMIKRGDIFIDVRGSRPGQVNGLSITSLGDYIFGRPSRITARTYVGKDGVINIDREVEMAGPIHNKGVLILAGYLNGKYGQEKPISLSASVVFEQLYEGVEGDSASSAELYALLSSLSGLPLKQNLAVTGSVNQHGYIQPIGGVTEKVEGFYDSCKAMDGLDGSQGVLIPKANVKNLMLRQEVVDAVKKGEFHIYPVETIDQGIGLLTGREAGERQKDGTYPEGTVNALVDGRLSEFARAWTKFRPDTSS